MLEKELPTLDNIIRELTESKFYGGITLKFESGKIVHCKKEESIKLFCSPLKEVLTGIGVL